LHGELLLDEPLMKKFCERRVVFGDKNTHEHTL
jgi:hypothetical protein